MAAVTEHGPGPAVKTCTVCGVGYTRKKGYAFKYWNSSTTCSRSCASQIGRRNRVWPSLADRFAEKVDRAPGQGPYGDCHEWRGHRIKWGYGGFKVGRQVRKAHRVAYELANGPIPEGALVLHSCDNPPCCNPAHLSLGSQVGNMADKRARGRNVKRGEEKLPRVDPDDPDSMPIPGDLNVT